jgi:hypothetical protein
MAAIGSVPNANGASISGTTLTLQPADATNGGVVNTTNQTFAGSKTFSSDISVNTVKVGKGSGTGTGNTALGTSTLNANTTGNYNTMVGGNTGVSNTTGSGNTALGYSSLNSNTTGINNVSIGYAALNSMNTYNYNVGVGGQALRYVKGNYNVAIGDGAGANLGTAATTGNDNNIMIGASAGYQAGLSGSNTAGKYSIFIGYDTRPAADAETNEIVISGYDGSAGTIGLGSNTTKIGNSATTMTALMGEVLVGSTTDGGAYKLQVTGDTKLTGTLTVTGGTPGLGKVLTSDANGLASWSNNGGASVLSKTASYTIATTDNANVLVFSGSTASQTITLPSAVTVGAGREITIKNISSVSLSIAASAGYLISDSTTSTATGLAIGIEPSNNWIKAISDGTNWIILRALF